MRKLTGTLFIITILFLCGTPPETIPIKLGAYYFDGWTGKTYHISPKLKKSFSEREPVWGWVTSTQTIMEAQIDLANDAGIDFFNFCWYNNNNPIAGDFKADPKNNALNLFLSSNNRSKLEFAIIVVNNGPYGIQTENWETLCAYWIEMFKTDNYLLNEGRPLITFFDMPALVKSMGSTQQVVRNFERFREMAKEAGFPGLSIAATFGSKPASIQMAQKCKIDIITGYNYAPYGLASSSDEIIPIDSMRRTEEKVWDQIVARWQKPIIPTITLSWDKRPWTKDSKIAKRFSGFSGQSVKKSIIDSKKWMAKNQSHLCSENIALIYAWNEYGEGAWLTPTKADKNHLLEGLKAGLNEN